MTLTGKQSTQQQIVLVPVSDYAPTNGPAAKRQKVELSMQGKVNAVSRQLSKKGPTAVVGRTATTINVRLRQSAKSSCLTTPNRMRVDVDDFLLAVDERHILNLKQATTHAAYRAEFDVRMLETERNDFIGPWYFCFCASPHDDKTAFAFEADRLRTVGRFFRCGKKMGMHQKTVHLAVHTLGRLLNALVKGNAGGHIPQRAVHGCMGSAWRMAVKFRELPEIAYNASLATYIDVHVVAKPSDMGIAGYEQMLNSVEGLATDTLGSNIGIPFAVDFFDRFLEVGGWPPDLSRSYMELGHFIIGLSFFSTALTVPESGISVNPLTGTVPSQVAAAALALAVKIINTDANMPSYDYFPPILATYTGYSFNTLRPTIRCLSSLLRNKPRGAECLEEWFPLWAKHGWE